jgi:hypothetical protein
VLPRVICVCESHPPSPNHKDSKCKHTYASSSKPHSSLLLTDSKSDVEIVEDIADVVDLSQVNSGHDRKWKGQVIELQHFNANIEDTLNDTG